MDDSRYQPSNNDRCHPKNSMCVKIDKRTKKNGKEFCTSEKKFVLTLKFISSTLSDVKQREFLACEFVTDHLRYQNEYFFFKYFPHQP